LNEVGVEWSWCFATVGGLRPGDEVRYGGIHVGRVQSIAIDPENPSKIRATFRDETTPMRVDTRASIIDVTGAVTRFISLSAGSPRSPRLPSGKEVASETGATAPVIAVEPYATMGIYADPQIVYRLEETTYGAPIESGQFR
jgi:ABC-type transporter Mla subunit MlaD